MIRNIIYEGKRKMQCATKILLITNYRSRNPPFMICAATLSNQPLPANSKEKKVGLPLNCLVAVERERFWDTKCWAILKEKEDSMSMGDTIQYSNLQIN